MPRTTVPAGNDAGPTPAKAPEAHLYSAPFPSIYPQVPLTAKPGDVWVWPNGDPPVDGRWEPTDLPVNTRPDNEPADPAKEG